MTVRVRIAPSPTGFWHIGNTRTALYNYLFARKMEGKFILRIEDTDRERYMPEAVGNIIEVLKWLGFKSDEGPKEGGPFDPYVQSERLKLYKEKADELVGKDFAYYDDKAIRFRTTKEGKTVWQDLIGDKQISFNNSTQEDFIILKSDGFPTYNFANVVDDHYMEVTHVIRGPEFISSTPKHLMLYKAFGWEPPRFGHVPMILGSDKSKLSKRHGSKPVLDFRDDGYLPEAIINYMALLGWTPPSGKEILSLEEMIKEFDIKDVNVASPIFDIRKLDWMNGEYIRLLTDEELTKRLQEYLVDHPAKDKIATVVPLIKERIKKLSDFIPMTNFLFEKPEYEKEIFVKVAGGKSVKEVLVAILKRMESLQKPWIAEDFEKQFRTLAEELGLSAAIIFQLVRVSISGQTVTPPLFESMKILGEDEVIKRVDYVAGTLFNSLD